MDMVDLFRSYRSEIKMSDEHCNRHHKGPASPLDEQLKAGSSKRKEPASGTVSLSFAEKKERVMNKRLGEKNKSDETTSPLQKVSGVRINCRGDRKGGRAQFEPIEVPISHPVWSAPIPSISKLVRLPIKVRRIASEIVPPAKSKRRKKPALDETNQAAMFLHMNANPNATDWGWAPLEWREPAGSVVVVHAERKEISPERVEALCHFCQYVMRPVFEDSLGAGMHPENPIPKSDVLRRLTPREFGLFYHGFQNWRNDNDPN